MKAGLFRHAAVMSSLLRRLQFQCKIVSAQPADIAPEIKAALHFQPVTMFLSTWYDDSNIAQKSRNYTYQDCHVSIEHVLQTFIVLCVLQLNS